MTFNQFIQEILRWSEKYASAHGYSIPWFSFWTQIVIMAVVCGIIFVLITMTGMGLIWMERKVSAHMQSRIGPNRVGHYGLLQSLADSLKLLLKEDIVPKQADHIVFWLAPIVVCIPAVMSFLVFPFYPGWIIQDLNLGILYLLAIASVTVLGIFMAGYASYNKYSLLGAMRTVAQVISYEVPAVLAILPVVMLAGSLNMTKIIESQQNLPNILSLWGLVSFTVYFIAATAETNRTPFDIPEAESELVAGYHTEYSGIKFSLFFAAEYTNMVIVCMIASSLFLGGWYGPFGPSPIWMFLKIITLIFVMMWFRWTFPRFRVDQMMTFGWKVLLPITFANIAWVGFWMMVRG